MEFQDNKSPFPKFLMVLLVTEVYRHAYHCHLSEKDMDRREISVVVVLLIILVGFIVVVVIIDPFRSPPVVEVEGGVALETDSQSSLVRAASMNFTISLLWNSIYDTGAFHINVTNVIPSQLSVDSSVDYSIITTGTKSRVFRIETTSLSATLRFQTDGSSKPLNFFIFGDTQGFQGGLEQITSAANEYNPDFLIHCGDLTPFGQYHQYLSVFSSLSNSNIPVFTTPGNHDIRLDGNEIYRNLFGPNKFSFEYKDVFFLFFDTSSGTVSEEDLVWIEYSLSQSSSERIVAISHMPLFDPRSGSNHSLTNSTNADILLTIFDDYEVDVYFSGHIHMFNSVVKNGTTHVISGGAGASLYASYEDGGFYHYTNVTLCPNNLHIEPIEIEAPSFPNDILVVRGLDEDVTLNIDDLFQLPQMTSYSTFQNQFGNWRGYGEYVGVKFSTLLDLVGGITPDMQIRVTAHDGFQQYFSYSNVFPNESWYSLQGDMVLAYQYNGTKVPDWSDGFRVVMMPDDEAYSNTDCALTSSPGMGYHIYPSAGARWVRFVSFVEVLMR
ncbi:MAG: 3',5'-cyclic adenosine monophosphate phosphodiesterase CpdA (modular protein) [Candidatus Thorarchaeota archaeon]|nr:MAG: 3',5'-cyclic adenosine monophosphate phosphodiesterase CpdA (modular protein) [Candidatus Thorarchaeota archaeon]